MNRSIMMFLFLNNDKKNATNKDNDASAVI